jgi:hypothetical protein
MIFKNVRFDLFDLSPWITGETDQLPDTQCWNRYDYEYTCDANGNPAGYEYPSDPELEPTPEPEPGSSSGDCSPIGAYKDVLDDRAFSYKGFHYQD